MIFMAGVSGFILYATFGAKPLYFWGNLGVFLIAGVSYTLAALKDPGIPW